MPATTTPAPIALVTGASRGLGKSTALNLAKTGHDMVLTYLNSDAEALEVVASFEAFTATLTSALPGHFGNDRLQVLVNNAGFGAHAAFGNTTPAQFDALMNVHLKGPYFLTQQLSRYMAKEMGARGIAVNTVAPGVWAKPKTSAP